MTPYFSRIVDAAQRPTLPRMVLRVGFVGHRDLREDAQPEIQSVLRSCFLQIANAVDALHPGQSHVDDVPLVSRFFSQDKPLIRLVSGLAEGADDLAFNAFQDTAQDARHAARLEFETAGIIPFEPSDYLSGRQESYQAQFISILQHENFSHLTILDGIYRKPANDNLLAQTQRRRAYRAQSRFLLRQCDLLIAVADPAAEEKPGGTLEGVREALDFQIPVVLVRTENCCQPQSNGPQEHPALISVRVFSPGEPFRFVAEGRRDPEDDERFPSDLDAAVQTILADPDTENEHYGPRRVNTGHKRLEAYFNELQTPPVRTTATEPGSLPERIPSWRERIWNRLERRFRRPVKEQSAVSQAAFQVRSRQVTSAELAIDIQSSAAHHIDRSPFNVYRDRATRLKYHFGGLYRGTYILNFTLAVVAVALASFSLAFLALEQRSALDRWLLVVFAVSKLIILMWIGYSIHEANDRRYSELAVDFRFLAERLRSMWFLPAIGSFRAPAAQSVLNAHRMVRQSGTEWLFQAIVRSVSPVDFAQREELTLTFAGQVSVVTIPVLRPNPLQASAVIRTRWVEEQMVYHENTSLRQRSMSDVLRMGVTGLNICVLVVVAIGLVLTVAEALHLVPTGWASIAIKGSVFLMVVAGLIPAAIASMNGVRVQSECERMAQRHSFMRLILGGRPAREPKRVVIGGHWLRGTRLIRRIHRKSAEPKNPATWSAEVLTWTESLATDMVQEVSDWPILHVRELIDP